MIPYKELIVLLLIFIDDNNFSVRFECSVTMIHWKKQCHTETYSTIIFIFLLISSMEQTMLWQSFAISALLKVFRLFRVVLISPENLKLLFKFE